MRAQLCRQLLQVLTLKLTKFNDHTHYFNKLQEAESVDGCGSKQNPTHQEKNTSTAPHRVRPSPVHHKGAGPKVDNHSHMPTGTLTVQVKFTHEDPKLTQISAEFSGHEKAENEQLFASGLPSPNADAKVKLFQAVANFRTRGDDIKVAVDSALEEYESECEKLKQQNFEVEDIKTVKNAVGTNVLGLLYLQAHEGNKDAKDAKAAKAAREYLRQIGWENADVQLLWETVARENVESKIKEITTLGQSQFELLQWLWLFSASLCEISSVSCQQNDVQSEAEELPCGTFDGDSSFDDIWNQFQALFLMYVAFATPYRIAFDAEPELWTFFFFFELSIDVSFALDVAKNL
eukprot:SAG31_NODE_235_length_19695_cov_37.959790_12_plen_348_part_00